MDWFERQVCPRIGATKRLGQKKSQKPPSLDKEKFEVTVGGNDYAMWLVAKGDQENLQAFVSDPEAFAEKREDTVIVFLDETVLWLKLRGEEQVLLSFKEVFESERRRALRAKLRKEQGREDQEAVEGLTRE